MKVTMTGWARNHGAKTICNRSVKLTEGSTPIRLTEASAFVSTDQPTGSTPRVTVQFGASKVLLNGDYFGTVSFSQSELAALFCLLFRERSFAEAHAAIEEALRALRED